MDYNSIIQNIVEDVLEECKKTRTDVHEEFCAYYVKLLKLDPNWRVPDDISYRQLDLNKFVEYVVSRLQDGEDPRMKIIKLQFYFEILSEHLERFVEDRRHILTAKLRPLETLILTYNRDEDDLDKKMDLVIHYLTLASGLGNPKIPQVYIEVKTVLKSVMDKDEFLQFLTSEDYERREKLDVLLKTVAGIRLYNNDCLKNGQGIPNLPVLLKNSIDNIKRVVTNSLKTESVEDRLCNLLKVLDSCYVPNKTKTKVVLDCVPPPNFTMEEMEYAKLLLVFYNQFSISIHKMLVEIAKIEERVSRIRDSYNGMLNFLHGKIKRNMSISATTFFPAFEKLYERWLRFQDETVSLLTLQLSFEEQFNLLKSIEFDDSFQRSFPGDSFKMRLYSGDAYIYHAELLARLGLKKVRIYKKDSFTNYRDIQFEYSGFCCWKLVSTNGVLSMGNADYGIIGYANKYYIFCDSIGLQSFIRDPDYYILHVLDLARKNYELIVILCIRDQIKQYKYTKKIIAKPLVEVRIHSGAQGTDLLPPVSQNFSYEWNVWNLRRRAVQLAKLNRCKTSSTQTVKCFSNHVGVQKNPLKDRAVQTNSDASTNTPQPRRHIFGLRGRKENIPFSMDLTQWEDFDYKNKTIK